VTTHWTERLSDYVDGELSTTESAACEAHLRECAECATVVAELRTVVAYAKRDPEQMPTANLWPGVLARIAPAETGSTAEVISWQAKRDAAARRSSRQFVFTLPQLALAASLLIAVSAGVAYLAAGRALSPSPAARENTIQAQAEPLLPASTSVERANFADAQYDEAVADLEKILVDMRDELDPRTVVVIERNLTAIDQAIREARAALDADPANTFLNSHLADARRKKLDLLRRATMISSTSGD
jgi:negative regulator of sigma E activity